ncbi:MAG TPA: hypothetical protein VMS56_03575 [Thermoanaerobaculia bacterium]|nr:hypothetical protein [Thermoanaerobaculia bacterium]
MGKHWHLSPEQWKVAQAVIRGEPVSQTCVRLGISEPRYKKDLHAVAEKVGARSRTELIETLRRPSAG